MFWRQLRFAKVSGWDEKYAFDHVTLSWELYRGDSEVFGESEGGYELLLHSLNGEVVMVGLEGDLPAWHWS